MGLPIGKENLHTLIFVDDHVVIMQDYDDAEYMFRKLIEEYDNGD